MTLRIALVQMLCPKGDVDGNLRAIERQVREAAARGVDLLLFPEMSITGYIDPAKWPDAVLTLESAAIRRFVALTDGLPMAASAGLVEHNPAGKPFITQLVARDGAMIVVYRKITVVDEEADWFAPGAAPCAFIHEGNVCGLAICADIDNPGLFAACAERGARLVLHAAAPGLYGEQATRDWQSGFDWWRGECHEKLGGYARQHGLWIATATQAGRTVDEDFPGGGYVFAPDGRCAAESADWSPGFLDAELPLAIHVPAGNE